MRQDKARVLALLCALALCLTACARPPVKTVLIEDGPTPLAAGPASPIVLSPSAPGKSVYSGGGASIDASNASDGYVMVKASGGKCKLLLTGPNKVTYTYTLHGKYEAFPLTSGDGSYTIGAYKNVSGNQYAQMVSKTIKVKLSDPLSPYLRPNQYVWYTADSKTVKKGAELAAQAADQLGIVQNVYNYTVNHITYDFDKANKAAAGQLPGYTPPVDEVIAAGAGICFDYAAVMAAMLRTQGIPTRLNVGYAGNVYHAWVDVYLKEAGWVNGIIQFDGKNWKLMDPTFASSANSSSSIMQFIGNGSNYSTKFRY